MRTVGVAIGVALAGLLAHVHAGPYALPGQRGAVWLESRQDVSDGSWPAASEAHTFLQTADAVLALHQANRRGAAYYSGRAWLENHEPRNLDARARRLLVLHTGQSNLQPDIDALAAGLSSLGAGQAGWGLASRYRASPLDTALALNALRSVGASFDSAAAIAYLKAAQRGVVGDQGWPAAASPTTDPYATARVIQALAPYRTIDASLSAPLANAVQALRNSVGVTSAPHVRATAAVAYLSMDAPGDAYTLLDSLVVLQRADGGFDAGLLASAVIIQAFATAEGLDASDSRVRVDLPDAALRAAVNAALGRRAMDQLNRGELAALTTLNISGRDIASLEGLQYAVNLVTLDASNNSITDTSPIEGLTQLVTVNLAGNPCPGCSPVASVPTPPWAMVVLALLLGTMALGSDRRQRG